MPAKPNLSLIHGNANINELAIAFKALTGRMPTQEEMREAIVLAGQDELIPEAHFGAHGGNAGHQWDGSAAQESALDLDDEELDQTPDDVVSMLGFDPKESE